MEAVTEFLNRLADKGVKLSAHAGRLNCYAQKGVLTEDLKDGITRFKPELIALLEGGSKKQQPNEHGRPREFALSAGQKGLYILQRLNPGISAYNVPLCLQFNSVIDPAVMARAWDHVLDQFPILTARVIERDGALYQRLEEGCRTTLRPRAIDFQDDVKLLSFLQKQAKQPFDLNRGPLNRIDLFMRNGQTAILLITVHHIVFDGASAFMVLKALLELYQQLSDGKPVRLSRELPGYQEFVAWEEAMLASPEGAAHARYWQQQLSGELPVFALLPDVPRQARVSFEGTTLVQDLPADLSLWAGAFSKAHSLPPSVIFLGFFQMLLHRYTNQDDIIIGMPVMGRFAQQFAAEVGYFVNMVPLRARLGGHLELLPFLRKVQSTMLDALYHSSYPFPLIVEGLESRRRNDGPIFRVSYAYQNFANPADFLSLLQQGRFKLEAVPGMWQEGDFELGLEIYEGHASSFSVHFKYSPELYARETIAGLFEDYCSLLQQARERWREGTIPYLGRSGAEIHLSQQLAYWRSRLADVPEAVGIQTDFPRPSVPGVTETTHAFAVDTQLTGQLKRLAEQKGATLFMVLLAAFKVLLHRYTGQSDLCVGSSVVARRNAMLEGLGETFVNTIVLRSQVDGEDRFSPLLSQIKATCLEAYEHQDAPLGQVLDVLELQRGAAAGPLFQVMVVMETPDRALSVRSGTGTWELTARFAETAEELTASIEYSSMLYRSRSIERMAGHFIWLCQSIVAAPTAKIQALDYFGEAEKHRLLVDYNDTRADYPKDKCVHQLVNEQLRRSPDRIAVKFGGQALTCRQLEEKANALASYLQASGVKPDSVVGLCVGPSLDMAVGVLGIAVAGGTSLLLDPALPDDSLAYMLQDSKAAVVLTQDAFRDRVGSLLAQNARRIALDGQWPEIVKRAAASKAAGIALRLDVKPDNASYLIYTSSSTGKPAGVLMEHGSLVNRFNSMQRSHPTGAGDVVLQMTLRGSDVALFELLWPLMAGAPVVLVTPNGEEDIAYLESVIAETSVTALYVSPKMLKTFLDSAKGTCNGVRRVFCSGERPDRTLIARYKGSFPNASLHCCYGPAEAAGVTACDCSQMNGSSLGIGVPIGGPIDNTQVYILDRHDHAQPIGVPGELHIAGDGLARGYLNRPTLTRERFIANPFIPGTRMFKTGDRARWLDDGNIQYLGRSPHSA